MTTFFYKMSGIDHYHQKDRVVVWGGISKYQLPWPPFPLALDHRLGCMISKRALQLLTKHSNRNILKKRNKVFQELVLLSKLWTLIWGWIPFIGISTNHFQLLHPWNMLYTLVICQLLHVDFTLTQPLHY